MHDWRPSTEIELLHRRARLISLIRQFFAERNILEVETPLLSRATVTDPYVIGIPAIFKAIGSSKEQTLYLQTSPEYAMKRLLAAGSGAIYQICKAFRQGEVGTIHNPEFTMLEWYRPGFDHHALMNEMDELLQIVLNTLSAERLSYSDAFLKYVNIDPHHATLEELAIRVKQEAIIYEEADRNTFLDLLLTHCIEPNIGKECPVFLYDFPASQAALAKIRPEDPPVASRFEVYFKGIELANGFHELQDAKEQRKRFENDLAYRAKNNISAAPIDEFFLSALEHGFPDCAGVALGIDRLIMLALEQDSIKDILSFEFGRA